MFLMSVGREVVQNLWRPRTWDSMLASVHVIEHAENVAVDDTASERGSFDLRHSSSHFLERSTQKQCNEV